MLPTEERNDKKRYGMERMEANRKDFLQAKGNLERSSERRRNGQKCKKKKNIKKERWRYGIR